MAESIFTTFRPTIGNPHPISEIVLIPDGGGRFDVVLDDEMVFSKHEAGRHTTPEEIAELLRPRLSV